jgi:hypothetical protein
MKQEMIIAISVFLVVFIIGFAIYAGGLGITGNVIDNNLDSNSNAEEVTEQDVLIALNNSQEIINEMQKQGFEVVHLKDLLVEAKNIFQQVKYAEILMNGTSSKLQKTEARQALSLISYQDLNYNQVIDVTNVILLQRDLGYLVRDKISLMGELDILSEGSQTVFEQVKQSFNDERYQEADEFLLELRDLLEQERIEAGTLNSLKYGTKNFFQRYWIFILIGLVIILVLIQIISKIVGRYKLISKIRKKKAQKQALTDLLKKAQEDRFRFNKISGLVYNVRSKKYKEKILEINQQLPNLEKELVGSRLRMRLNKKSKNVKKNKSASKSKINKPKKRIKNKK